MSIDAKILADSVNPDGVRLTTFELRYPRFIHSELMTHRMFSRNAASSRAIPIQKMIRAVIKDPAMPVWWGRNQKGMQAQEELKGWRRWLVVTIWLMARWFAVLVAWTLWKLDLHKQIANRVLEPWSHITVILTGTDFSNFYNLRAHPDAQPEFQQLAYLMKNVHELNIPRCLAWGDWHLPLVSDDPNSELHVPLDCPDRAKVSAGRCARISYLTHDGRRDLDEDVKLCERLSRSGHWSPMEHPARAVQGIGYSGNFRGFVQFRKTFAGEAGPGEKKWPETTVYGLLDTVRKMS